jgi:lipoprotein-anchoring transpeptidase ErfK/SrfK
VASGSLDLRSVPVAPVRTDAGPLVEKAQARLNEPLVLRARDPIRDESLWWTPPVEVWSMWLDLAVDPADRDNLLWDVDLEAVRAYVEGQADLIEPERHVEVDSVVKAVAQAMVEEDSGVSFRVYHRPTTHTVQLGETLASIARDHGFPYPWLEQANPGVEALHPGQVIAIPSPDVLLPLPVAWHKRIVISIQQQRMWAYEWDKLAWEWTVSTGIPSSPTSPGVFQVQEHEENAYAASWDLWMPYFIGIYRPVPTASFMNGFHGFPTRDGTTLLWTGNLGYPVTYGCILVSTNNAAHLYGWAEPGVIVEIQP